MASRPPELCPQKPELRWSEYALSFTSNLVTWTSKQPSPDHRLTQSEEIAPSSSGPNSSPRILDHQAEQDSRGHCMPPSCPHFKLSPRPSFRETSETPKHPPPPAHPILKFFFFKFRSSQASYPPVGREEVKSPELPCLLAAFNILLHLHQVTASFSHLISV